MAPPVCLSLYGKEGKRCKFHFTWIVSILPFVHFCIYCFLVSKWSVVGGYLYWILASDGKFKKFWQFDCQTEICMFRKIMCALTCICVFETWKAFWVSFAYVLICAIFIVYILFLYSLLLFFRIHRHFCSWKYQYLPLCLWLKISRKCSWRDAKHMFVLPGHCWYYFYSHFNFLYLAFFFTCLIGYGWSLEFASDISTVCLNPRLIFFPSSICCLCSGSITDLTVDDLLLYRFCCIKC